MDDDVDDDRERERDGKHLTRVKRDKEKVNKIKMKETNAKRNKQNTTTQT